MNLFNRIITVLLLLGLIACAALVAVGVFLPPAMRSAAADGVASLFMMPSTLPPMQRIVVAVVAALVALLAFFLLVFEMRPGDTGSTVRVKTAGGEETSVVRSAIHDRVQFAVDRLDDVIQVEPTIQGGSSGLNVHLNVTTSPYIDVPMKTEEIRAVARDVIEKQMGLVLRKLTLTVDHQRYEQFARDDNLGV